MSPRIPLVDLAAAHAEIAHAVQAGFAEVLATTGFVGGPQVAAFEREYAAFAGVKHCVGVANGTDAVELALRAVGVRPGEEVIVPANTFAATAGAVVRAGAEPVFVDCDRSTCLIDVPAALAAIGPATKAIVPVHLYGQLAPVEELRAGLNGLSEAVRSRVRIVEDAAQCQGARRRGRTPGSGPGAIAATSFYPGKNLGAYGDAGAVLTDDEDLAETVRKLGSHGGLAKYAHDIPGVNSRLDALQAVVLRAKLRRLPEWNVARQEAASYYDKLLGGLDGVTVPTVLPGNEHVWHLYTVQVAARDAVLAELEAEGIGAGIHYPVPLHHTGAFATDASFPHAEHIAAHTLSLPLHPHLMREQQETVVAALARALSAPRRRPL
ncbi:DegT/DnrJ/EryC1/StrS family aminotransferase [Catenulispora sp. NF23]|uniref:DegT/DnrJ/EryC1/StrS family aminotransferase n=1 Tax=Catenulispora pinistramenti TaxID=2705254 RepID=A0ABS5KVR7_9ACTN|nr:DegT/DnrJ/EryC1/StrS family aminotransferase [Catenulispora pinistramenti]MBS2536121.1 DegT/DnrJ/EryC1/StrS family aminotransferase [Catenulispora pinistramenti]MBS2550162.1 DegT/DnrJ/EryC1/StrS family aminotransferase [Catenulispora pinistramenti]